MSAVSVCSIFALSGPAFATDAGTGTGVAPPAEGGAEDATPSRDAAADGSTTLPPPRHVIGNGCSKDADCAVGLTCVPTSSDALGTGGPPGGLCTVDCRANGQADCDRIDTGSTCASNQSNTIAFCYETCTAGPVSSGEHDAGKSPEGGKCHDRADFACTPSQTGDGYCTPTCRGDFDCAGRACEPRTGLCSAATEGTRLLGESCDPALSSTDCIGTCSTLGTSLPTKNNSFCTTLCTIGKPGSCGEALTPSGPAGAACILKFASRETEGDLGECAQLCDCDSDCKNPGFICSPTVIPQGTDTGRAGACVPKLTFDGVTPGMPCPRKGTADAAPAPSPDAAPPPDAGTSPEAGMIAASATGGCDCRASGGRPEGAVPAFGALLAVATLRGRRLRRSRGASSAR